jgi:nicotinamidase-related amidase
MGRGRESTSGDWRSVLGAEDAGNLARYSRQRGPFEGGSPTLMVVDVTEAFVGPDLLVAEAQETWRQACGEKAWAAVPAIVRLIDAFRRANRPVMFTTPDGGQQWTGPVTRGTSSADQAAGRQIIAPLTPAEDEWVLRKPKASAFFGTPLVTSLVNIGCDTIVLAGGTTSGCVRATAVDGCSYGFEMLVAEDGCFDRATLSHLVSLADLDAKYARVLPADQIIHTLGFG